MAQVEKCAVPVFLNDEGQPIGMIFFSKNRERIIYQMKKANEDQIIEMFEGKNKTIKNEPNTTG